MDDKVKALSSLLPKRKENSHKGTYGRLGIIAGSRGMTGAAYLACKSALRTGSGLVYSLIPESLEAIMSVKLTEAIIKPIRDKGTGHFLKESLSYILDEIKGLDSLALGPGMGLDEDRVFLTREIIKNTSLPMLIDADGLNCISKDLDILNHKKGPIIISPHPGEMARLLNKRIGEIESKRDYYAQYISKEFNIITVLKGHQTIVTSPQGGLYINKTGNPGMATAGSGDVLTGIITSLLGQGLDPYDSARLGVYLHGLAGDLAREKLGEAGMIAGDILEAIPLAIMKIQSRR